MPSSIAFFPWVSVPESIEVGPVRLLPYERDLLPGNQPGASQADINAILSAYIDPPRYAVRRATLVEYGAWQLGNDSSKSRVQLFRARALVGFSALARRTLFRGHIGYCNYDTYEMVVQSYEPGNVKHFSYFTRRRDGSTQHLGSVDLSRFFRPSHVETHARADLDLPLLAASLEAVDAKPHLVTAIEEFNAANSDSLDIPEHVEMVMAKSAFESLLGIGSKVDAFVGALREALAGAVDHETKMEGPFEERWRARWPGAKSLLEAWARDFCDLRGSYAHGRRGAADRFVWQRRQHLAFSAVFFPLLLKKHLADECGFRPAERDIELLKRIEGLLVCDPFAGDPSGGLGDPSKEFVHPWEKVQERVSSVLLERRIREAWENSGSLYSDMSSLSGDATEDSNGGGIDSDMFGSEVHDGTDQEGP